MITLRRYLSLCALLFWQGGFTFYALLVIPITRHVLRDHGQLSLAALITGPATTWLNGIGVGTLVVLFWDLAATADASRRRRRWRGTAWAMLFLTLAALFALHFTLDKIGPVDNLAPDDRPTFWMMHSLYLTACTLQWAASLAYLGLAVSAWARTISKQKLGKRLRRRMGWKRKRGNKKSSAVGFFGVAQSPKPSYGGTMENITHEMSFARGNPKKCKKSQNLSPAPSSGCRVG